MNELALSKYIFFIRYSKKCLTNKNYMLKYLLNMLFTIKNLSKEVIKMSAISIIPERCTGCQSCEMVCSLSHEGSCSSSLSRIRMKKWEEISVFMPIVCQHCEKPPCMDICPTGARKRVPGTDAVVTDEKRCVGCKSCHLCLSLWRSSASSCYQTDHDLRPLQRLSPFAHRSAPPEHFLISLKEIPRWKGREPSGKSFFIP